jgi:hypothetical protein
MTKDSIAEALASEGLTAGAQGYVIPDNREAACLVAAPGEVFSVDRLVRVELRDKHVLLANARHEHFFFSYDDILGFRVIAGPAARERTTGFGR